MKKPYRSRAFGTIAVSVSLLAALGVGSAQAEGGAPSGHVYASTNSASGNAVVVYDRAPDGTLTEAQKVSTGGRGSGVPAGGGFEQSQNGLVLGGSLGAEVTPFTSDLFAVNAGSNEISVLDVGGDEVTLVDKVPSGGVKPTSITVHDDVLYVLNSGVLPLGMGLTPSITGFRIQRSDHGVRLVPIPGSTRQLTGSVTTGGATEAGAAEVLFATDGATLTVSERNANVLDTFRVRRDGTLSRPVPTDAGDGTLFGVPLPTGLAAPFGFAASRRHPGRIFVAQGHNAVPTQGGFGSYDTNAAGGLNPITANAPNGGSDTCWVVLTKDERYAYLTNFASGTISSYSIDPDGAIALVHAVAATPGLATGPNDEAMSIDGRYLYERNFVTGTIDSYRIDDHGSLAPIGVNNGLPAATGFGLAAR